MRASLALITLSGCDDPDVLRQLNPCLTIVNCDPIRALGISGCEVVETVGVGLTRAPLEAAAAQGFSVKLQGRRDSVILDVPARYFAGFLEALNGAAAR